MKYIKGYRLFENKLLSEWTPEEIRPTQDISVELLAQLSKSEDDTIKYAVAQHPNTPMSVLEEMLDTTDSNFISIEYYVAKNPNLSPELAVRISQSTSDSVRAQIAKNPNLPLENFEELAQDPDWYVRSVIALSDRVSDEILSKLVSDGNEHVVKSARIVIDHRFQRLLSEF
jgi:hypothetical protein